MIAETYNETVVFLDTREGQRARADYYESLYKVEKLDNAKLRIANRSLTHRIYGQSSEKLNEAQRLLFGILPDAPPPLSDEAKVLMKEAKKGTEDRGSDEPKRKRGGRNMDRFANLPEQVELINPPEEERKGKVWVSEVIGVSELLTS